jgi:hypothetical protein
VGSIHSTSEGNTTLTTTTKTMKNKQQTTTILTAIAYLIDRQGLSPAEIQEIVIKTATELEQ